MAFEKFVARRGFQKREMRKAQGGHKVQLHALTALRFFAAIWIVIYHFRDQAPEAGTLLDPFIFAGPKAVDFFFVLSGFVIALSYSNRLARGELGFGQYLFRRFARLYPLHLFCLGCLLVLWIAVTLAGKGDLLSPAKYDFGQLWAHVLMLNAFGVTPGNAWNIPSWTISAEFFAYCVFGAGIGVIRLMVNARPAIFCVAILCVTALLDFGLSWLSGSGLAGMQYNFGIVRIMPCFLLGVGLHRIYERGSSIPNWSPIPAIGLVVIGPYIGLPYVGFAACFGVIVLGVACAEKRGQVPRFLVRPGLVFLGEASYSLYMTHGIVQTVFFHGLAMFGFAPSWGGVLAGAALSILVAAAGYLIIEKPAQRFLLSFLRPRSFAPNVPSSRVDQAA